MDLMMKLRKAYSHALGLETFVHARRWVVASMFYAPAWTLLFLAWIHSVGLFTLGFLVIEGYALSQSLRVVSISRQSQLIDLKRNGTAFGIACSLLTLPLIIGVLYLTIHV